MEVEELLNKADMYYLKALELLDSGDYYNAAEKAWLAIETVRKAFLVAIGVPYEKAKSVSYSLPIFSKLMRALGRKDLLKDYDWLHHKLHAMGFYENITLVEEIIDLVKEDTRRWILEMRKLIDKVKGLDISDVLREYEKALELKRQLISKSAELMRINEEINSMLNKLVASKLDS